jgi:hypothetical protein
VTKQIASTRILCTDDPKHPRHEVRLYDDGSVDCDCGSTAIEEGRRIGASVTLGTVNVLRRSCAGLVAFLTMGLPRLVAARVDTTGNWGGWKDAWVSYAANGLVREVYSRLARARDAEHGEMLKIAHKAIGSCQRYRNGMSGRDFRDEICFVPDGAIAVGQPVALFSSDQWTVPLQRGWLESVGKAKPVIDGRFIVGVNEKHAGFVFAIDGTDDNGFEICEFAVVGHRLGKVAVAR